LELAVLKDSGTPLLINFARLSAGSAISIVRLGDREERPLFCPGGQRQLTSGSISTIKVNPDAAETYGFPRGLLGVKEMS
jgi:hypothetical protein